MSHDTTDRIQHQGREQCNGHDRSPDARGVNTGNSMPVCTSCQRTAGKSLADDGLCCMCVYGPIWEATPTGCRPQRETTCAQSCYMSVCKDDPCEPSKSSRGKTTTNGDDELRRARVRAMRACVRCVRCVYVGDACVRVVSVCVCVCATRVCASCVRVVCVCVCSCCGQWAKIQRAARHMMMPD